MLFIVDKDHRSHLVAETVWTCDLEDGVWVIELANLHRGGVELMVNNSEARFGFVAIVYDKDGTDRTYLDCGLIRVNGVPWGGIVSGEISSLVLEFKR